MSTQIITAPLWAISETLQALIDTAEMAPEEQQAEIQASIAEFMGIEKSKVDQVCQFLSVCDYAAKDCDDEIARLQERRQAARKASERIEGYILRIMQERDVKRLDGKTNTLYIRQSDAVIITDATAIPVEFQRTKTTVEPDKAAIKKALKAGADVPGADLEFREALQRK